MATRRKRTAKPTTLEALIGSDRELLKTLVKESLHEVLEAEMTEAVGAGPGERTADRCGALFSPRDASHRFCRPACRPRAQRRREADRRADLLRRLLPDDPGRPE